MLMEWICTMLNFWKNAFPMKKCWLKSRKWPSASPIWVIFCKGPCGAWE